VGKVPFPTITLPADDTPPAKRIKLNGLCPYRVRVIKRSMGSGMGFRTWL
jgi:hypothetical protein